MQIVAGSLMHTCGKWNWLPMRACTPWHFPRFQGLVHLHSHWPIQPAVLILGYDVGRAEANGNTKETWQWADRPRRQDPHPHSQLSVHESQTPCTLSCHTSTHGLQASLASVTHTARRAIDKATNNQHLHSEMKISQCTVLFNSISNYCTIYSPE